MWTIGRPSGSAASTSKDGADDGGPDVPDDVPADTGNSVRVQLGLTGGEHIALAGVTVKPIDRYVQRPRSLEDANSWYSGRNAGSTAQPIPTPMTNAVPTKKIDRAAA